MYSITSSGVRYLMELFLLTSKRTAVELMSSLTYGFKEWIEFLFITEMNKGKKAEKILCF